MSKEFTLGNCPNCGESWKGEPIPKHLRKHYEPPYFWGKLIGIEIPEKYDGVSYWQCPFCKTYFDRWTEKETEVLE